MALAVRFNWTPDQVGRMDPDFVEELVARINAGSELDRERAREAQRRREQAGRRGKWNGIPGRYVVASVPIDD